jgi:hypothetical protein
LVDLLTCFHQPIDDGSDEEFLMQQFNWIEEDQEQPRKNVQLKSCETQPSCHSKKPMVDEIQTDETARAATPITNNTTSVIDTISVSLSSLAMPTIDIAMTQSEDFLQEVEAEGDIQIRAEEIEKHSKQSSTTLKNEVVENQEGEVDPASRVNPDVLVKDGAVLQEQGETENVSIAQAIPVVTKPKKKAHRSKRGGKNQREKQMNKQLIIGNDDDGPMFLDEPSDEDDEEAMEDYLLVTLNEMIML